MKWDKHESSRDTFYTGEAGTLPRAEAMAELWNVVADEVLPRNESVDWDHLRAEFWPDSGRIIVFPASSRVVDRIEKAGCQVIFSELLSAYDQLADSDIDDDAFTEQLRTVKAAWADDLEKAARASRLSNLRISFWESDGEEAFREVVLP